MLLATYTIHVELQLESIDSLVTSLAFMSSEFDADKNCFLEFLLLYTFSLAFYVILSHAISRLLLARCTFRHLAGPLNITA